MTTIVLVGCGAAKVDVDDAVPARELYTSNYFDLKRRYAETFGDQWAILSAEHAILLPSSEVAPYETTMDDVSSTKWADEVIGGLTAVVHTAQAFGGIDSPSTISIEVLAGRDYVRPLRSRLANLEVGEVRYPFDETSGIGDQMGWLSSQLEEHSETNASDNGNQ